MSGHETERLQFIEDPAPYHSWTVIDKATGKTIAKVNNDPHCVSLLASGAKLYLPHVLDILELMQSITPDQPPCEKSSSTSR